jgi:hypothetical protein
MTCTKLLPVSHPSTDHYVLYCLLIMLFIVCLSHWNRSSTGMRSSDLLNFIIVPLVHWVRGEWVEGWINEWVSEWINEQTKSLEHWEWLYFSFSSSRSQALTTNSVLGPQQFPTSSSILQSLLNDLMHLEDRSLISSFACPPLCPNFLNWVLTTGWFIGTHISQRTNKIPK